MQAPSEKKKETVRHFLDRKVLLGSDFTERITESFEKEKLCQWLMPRIEGGDCVFLNFQLIELLNNGGRVDFARLEREKALREKGIDVGEHSGLSKKSEKDPSEKGAAPAVNIKFSYDKEPKKKEINDFVQLFNRRFESLRKILMNRQELQGATSIARVAGKKEKSECAIIGAVMQKNHTSNNNIMLTLEDQTGTIKVFAGKNRQDIYGLAREVVLDEVIGVVGTSGDNIVFSNTIITPDIPANKEVKKAPESGHAIFLSDLHVGSKQFLPEEFSKFLSWIKGETGTEKQRETASKVKYIFIVGDLVDGVGVYPEQDSELVIQDIYEQYQRCAELLKEIPERIRIIICPGNHDAVRISEPQPCLSREFAKPLWEMPNVTMVSNPSIVNIHSSEGFPGFDVLLYHGYSFDYYVANVDVLREKGGYDRADLIMRFLLQRRHLAPAYSSTLYVADPEQDTLVIEKPPDFFVTGHIHKSFVANYRNITTVCGSCWQSTTSFQEKVGHHPEPARVPVVDLQTRQVKILRFDK